jgi:ribose transport system ATP-binding protein
LLFFLNTNILFLLPKRCREIYPGVVEEEKQMSGNNEVFVSMTGISKNFPGVRALNNVNVNVKRGEVLAIVGENGAGKSTLIKILSGIYHQDEGDICIDGKSVRITSPRHAQELGISTIFQEPSLAQHLTGVQNVYLGKEKEKGKVIRALDESGMARESREMYAKFFDTVDDLDVPVSELGALKNRVIEIIKALSMNSQLMIMDEPTAALADKEKDVLREFIKMLRSQNIAVIYITHHLKELFGIADRIVVMRDGESVGEMATGDTDIDELVSKMVGRTITNYVVKENVLIGDEILRVENMSRKGIIEDISLHVNKGEIVGLAGLAGAGRTETVRAIIGADRIDSGKVHIGGEPARIKIPRDAIKAGIGMLPENRKLQGALVDMDVRENITLTNLNGILHGKLLIDRKKEESVANEYVARLGVKTPSIFSVVNSLSGGNQQKVILAKWLFADPDLLIFDEPTQGIDIGAKHEIYNLIADFVKSGGGILLVSSELAELTGLSDRIYVMNRGRIVHEFHRGEFNEENITLYASGGHE